MHVLTMEKFNGLAEQHKRIALILRSKRARMLALPAPHQQRQRILQAS